MEYDCTPNGRLGLTDHDFRVQDEGTIVILHPCNDAAGAWISDHLYDGQETQWWGGGIVIERRYVQNILDGITQDGLTIQ